MLGLKRISQFQEHPSPLSLILIRPFTKKEAGGGGGGGGGLQYENYRDAHHLMKG